MFGRVVLDEIISKVMFPSHPVYEKMSLLDFIPHPIESHIDCVGSSLADIVIGESAPCCTICCFRLVGRLCPISIRARCIAATFWHLTNNAPNSASIALANTLRIVVYYTQTIPLKGGGVFGAILGYFGVVII